MSTTLRYIPIPQQPPEMPLPQGNLTMVNNTFITSRVAVTIPPGEQFEPLSHETIVLIVLITMLITCSILILLLIRSKPIYNVTYVKTFVKQQIEGIGEISYHYSGLKLILRKIFLELRSRLKIGNKTPREMALIENKTRDFAEIYEDVVYGDKERRDFWVVIEFVKKVFNIEE